MSEPQEQSRAQQLVGDFAPKLAELTDEVLFGDVWARAELSPRDRSLVTVAALIANGNTEQLDGKALDRLGHVSGERKRPAGQILARFGYEV
ncbi:MAG: carboxymuconolactone decarboxylase family protein [Thermoflexales bacterium]|nr:carboxymuconolactone decarboxylase family protein [Thermoflexales bacterium]